MTMQTTLKKYSKSDIPSFRAETDILLREIANRCYLWAIGRAAIDGCGSKLLTKWVQEKR